MLRVVDISSAQSGIDASALDCDAVIVKVTGGDYYTNDDWQRQAESALAGGKLLGLYHYARDSRGGYSTPEIEARRFLDAIQPYIGRCVLALDWEHEADAYPISWAREWCEIVQRETGSVPVFYAGAGDINKRDFSCVAQYPLWMSSYLFRYYYSGWVDDPINTWSLGAWNRMTMYQYTSTGRIDGYDDDLDLSIFYGDEGDWQALIGGGRMRKEKMVQLAIDVANDDSHGYSQASRWPWQGSDFDCSSLMYWSAHEAGYDVPLSGYTGTMLADFTNAGFTAHNYGSVDLERGDILLAHNDNRQHTEMYIGDGQTVGAHSSETGGIYGQPGDQTGNEISIAPNYGGWDYVLRPPFETSEVLDMAEAIIYIDDDHEGYKAGDVVYWSPSAGFCFMEHPDSIWLLKQCSKGIFELHSSSEAPWVVRAHHVTNPTVAAKTYGKRN